MNIKSFLGKQIDKDTSLTSETLVVQPRHRAEDLNMLTKKEVIEYAHQHGISVNSRKKKEELIELIVRS